MGARLAGVRVVIYGSRPDGHARVVLEVLLAGEVHEVVGLVDDLPENRRRKIGMLEVIGSCDDLRRLSAEGVEGVVLGFGAAEGRDGVVGAVEAAGLKLPTLVHPSAYVAPSAQLGSGLQVLPQASIGPGAHIGRGVLINTGAIIEHDVGVGDFAVVGPGAVLAGRATVGESVELGARAVVLPDIDVGAHAVVGAGAVARRDVLANQTVVGVPARPLARLAQDR
jgi:sugar O-acyltransferase (sialic acid O-acetyltransferase NeuD family)